VTSGSRTRFETMPRSVAAPPHYSKRETYGPFHRLTSVTQDAETLREQLKSGQVWGETGSEEIGPVAEAWKGPLADHESGIEFWAFAPPERPWGSVLRWWRERDCVTIDKEIDVVKVEVAIVRLSDDWIEAMQCLG